MSIQKDWWNNQQYLQNMGMQSCQDHMYDTTQFAYQTMNLRIPNDQLRYQNMTAQDVLQHFDRFNKSRDEYVHPGPTNLDLRHPAVANAWREFQIIHKLSIGVKYEEN